MKLTDQQLLEEAYDEVLSEGITSALPHIPVILNTISGSAQSGGSGRQVGEGDLFVVLVCGFITVLISAIAVGIMAKESGWMTKIKHWFLSFFSGKIDVQEVEKAAAKAKELMSGSKKGAVTLWTNRLKLAAKHKDRAGIHEAFTRLKKLINQ